MRAEEVLSETPLIESYIDGLSISRKASPIAKIVAKGGGRSGQRTGGRVLGKGSPEGIAKPAPLPEKLSAAVDAGSILSFVDGVDAREQSDILYSVQLAQRAADAACNRFVETKTWYGKYNEVLEAVGWATEQYAFSAHEQGQGNFRMDKAALGVITGIASGNQLQALTSSIAALEKLAEDDGAITLLDYYATADMSGNFQIGGVQKSKNGSLSMALGAFYFRTTAKRKKFLFFQWGANEVNFWTAAQKMTLNTAIYEKVRSAVEKRLGEKALEHIASIDIR